MELRESEGGGRPSRIGMLWERVLAGPLRRVDEEARAYQASAAAQRVDSKTIVVLLTVTVVLTLQHYLQGEAGARLLARGLAWLGLDGAGAYLLTVLRDPEHGQFHQLLYWCAIRVFGWLVIPAAVVWLVFRERARDYGAKLDGMTAGLGLYLLMLAVVLPLVVVASTWSSFQQTYPFYNPAAEEPLWPRFWCWELAYAVHFFALEFFFRGFLVHGTRHRFGCYSVLVMVVPYCMIHFGKPLPETLGSIVAGLALGFMSLKTRSVWMGTAVHVIVALAMDFLSLARQGRLG